MRSLPAQGYRLVTAPDAITIQAGDAEGLRYGRATLAQLRHRSNASVAWGEADGTVAECEITDWPDHLVRGVMIDVSRDKVPTLATLEALIERLAGWKYNHVELYMEHTFAYVGHEEVWRDADPLTSADLAHLDRLCRSLGVDLVPNQNTLGHFDRWLRHDALPTSGGSSRRIRLDVRDKTVANDTRSRQARVVRSGLRPPRTAHYRARQASDPHRARRAMGALGRAIGGMGRLVASASSVWTFSRTANCSSGETCRRDTPRSWTEVGRLADADLTICEWGYEGNHPFEDRLSALERAGLARWVCPGTSSWMSVTGRAVDMLENVRSAARAGEAHGATGYPRDRLGRLRAPPIPAGQ